MSRFIDILRDSSIALVTGLAISLLVLAPESWFVDINKFHVGLIFAVTLVGGILLKIFYQDLRLFAESRSDVKEYYGYMPRTIKFKKFSRTYQICENQDAEVDYIMKITNTSKRPLSNISISFFIEIPSNTNENDSAITVKSVRVDTREIDAPEQCYKKIGILKGPQKNDEIGNFWIPLSLKGKKGKKTDEVEIRIQFTAKGFFRRIFSNGEFIVMNVDHPTELNELTVLPPPDSTIFIQSSEDSPEGIEVRDQSIHVIEYEEMSLVEKPRSGDGRNITWQIKNSKMNYMYKIYFKCKKITSSSASASDNPND